jgi:hypothetical protein
MRWLQNDRLSAQQFKGRISSIGGRPTHDFHECHTRSSGAHHEPQRIPPRAPIAQQPVSPPSQPRGAVPACRARNAVADHRRRNRGHRPRTWRTQGHRAQRARAGGRAGVGGGAERGATAAAGATRRLAAAPGTCAAPQVAASHPGTPRRWPDRAQRSRPQKLGRVDGAAEPWAPSASSLSRWSHPRNLPGFSRPSGSSFALVATTSGLTWPCLPSSTM